MNKSNFSEMLKDISGLSESVKGIQDGFHKQLGKNRALLNKDFPGLEEELKIMVLNKDFEGIKGKMSEIHQLMNKADGRSNNNG